MAVCGLNPLDIKIRAGKAPHAKHPLPLVLGMDLAGSLGRSPVLTGERDRLPHAVPQFLEQACEAAAQPGVLEFASPDFRIEPRTIIRVSLTGHLACVWNVTYARLPSFALEMWVIARMKTRLRRSRWQLTLRKPCSLLRALAGGCAAKVHFVGTFSDARRISAVGL